MNAPKSKDVRNNVTENVATEAPKATAAPGVSLGNRRNRNPRKNGVAQQRAYVPSDKLPPLPTHKEDVKAETKIDAKAEPTTVEHAPMPEIAVLNLDDLATAMATQIVAGAVANGLTLSTKQISTINNNCFYLLESTSAEVVTEEWAMGIATQVAGSFTSPDGDEVDDESAVALAEDINAHIIDVLTSKYTSDELIHRYTAKEVEAMVAHHFEEKYQAKLPQEQFDGLVSFSSMLPESGLCQWVVDLFLGFTDIVADSMSEQIIDKIAENLAAEALAAAAENPEVVEPVDETKPHVTKVKMTSGTGHSREEVEVEIEGDLSGGGSIHIKLPAEKLRVIAIHDASLVGIAHEWSIMANHKAILNRALQDKEVIDEDTKKRLIAEAFAIRAAGGYPQAEFRVGSISFDFNLDSIDMVHIRACHNGPSYQEYLGTKKHDKLTKGHKTITIAEYWWQKYDLVA